MLCNWCALKAINNRWQLTSESILLQIVVHSAATDICGTQFQHTVFGTQETVRLVGNIQLKMYSTTKDNICFFFITATIWIGWITTRVYGWDTTRSNNEVDGFLKT